MVGYTSKGFTIKGSVGFTSPKGGLVRYASRILMRCKEFCRDEVLARTHEAFRAIRKPSICQVKPFEVGYT
jgi:hypothetical protein